MNCLLLPDKANGAAGLVKKNKNVLVICTRQVTAEKMRVKKTRKTHKKV